MVCLRAMITPAKSFSSQNSMTESPSHLKSDEFLELDLQKGCRDDALMTPVILSFESLTPSIRQRPTRIKNTSVKLDGYVTYK